MVTTSGEAGGWFCLGTATVGWFCLGTATAGWLCFGMVTAGVSTGLRLSDGWERVGLGFLTRSLAPVEMDPMEPCAADGVGRLEPCAADGVGRLEPCAADGAGRPVVGAAWVVEDRCSNASTRSSSRM